MAKRKLGSAVGGGSRHQPAGKKQAEPRSKASSSATATAAATGSKKRPKQQHNDAAERAAAKALARAAHGREEEEESGASSSSGSGSGSEFEFDDPEAAAAFLKQGPPSNSSDDDDSEEDSEDDIKMYGDEAGSADSDSSDDDSEEEDEEDEEAALQAAAKGKGKGKEKAEEAAPKKGSKKEGKGKDEEGKAVEVSFDFSDPGERFFFGTRALLGWLKHEGVDTTALAELIGQEKGLGTVIHCTEEDDVFALATTLNVQAHLEANEEGMRSLVALLKAKCPPTLKPALEVALGSPETYIFLHARFVNLPLPLVPLLHKSGEEDRAWAQESDPGLPRIKTLITLSPCTVDCGSAAALPYAPNDAIYDRFEDELWVQGAELSFCVPRSAAGEGEEGASKTGKAAASSSSQGYVVSLLHGSAVAESLPQIEEMAQ